MKATLLIVDDEERLRKLLARILELEGYHILQAQNVHSAFKILLHEEVHVVISDVKLPDGNGFDVLAKLKQQYNWIEVVMLTAFGNISDGVAAIKKGAFDYLTKGDENEKIIPVVSKAVEKALLQQKVQRLESKIIEKYGFDSIIGNSKSLLEAIEMAKSVADTDTTVLLTGETGTGKEVFAQAIHYESPRKNQPFVAINCSAFGREILESELFGHKAGAFTGATKDKKGLFEEANKGTIFLDEIGEMHIDMQAKLLRVLENQTFIRVGDTKPTHVNVRVIAATNRDLQKESEENHFRLDLYYRLAVFQIKLPSLRERGKDIVLLANYFLKVYAGKTGKKVQAMSEEFLEKISQYQWKGNIRELKNVMERAVILAKTDTLDIAQLPFDVLHPLDYHNHNSLTLAEMEKNHIKRVLHHAKGNKTLTAKLLDIGLTTLYQKLKDYEIEK
jgi:DNA-binding NtrC family response regulator